MAYQQPSAPPPQYYQQDTGYPSQTGYPAQQQGYAPVPAAGYGAYPPPAPQQQSNVVVVAQQQVSSQSVSLAVFIMCLPNSFASTHGAPVATSDTEGDLQGRQDH